MSDQETTNQEAPTETVVETVEAPKAGKTRQMTFTVLETGEIRADFGEGVEPLLLAPTQVPEALQAAAVTEGLISRLRGYTSKLQDAARTPAALQAAVAKGIENLKAGVWKIERAPGEGTPEYSAEVEAAFVFRQMRAKAKGEEFTGTIAEAAENFAKLDDEQKKALKALPKYQIAWAEVKARRAAAKLESLRKKDAEAGDDTAGF